MSQRVLIDREPVGPPKRGIGAGVPIAAASSATAPSTAKICEIRSLNFDKNCALTKIGVIPDAAAAYNYVTFFLVVNGRVWDVQPYNNIVNGMGTPWQPMDVHDELPPGATVELWGKNIDTGNAYNASGMIEAQEEAR